MTTTTEHGIEHDTGVTCRCGDEIVYFEDPDQHGWTGMGCEILGVWWAAGMDVCRAHGRRNCPDERCENE